MSYVVLISANNNEDTILCPIDRINLTVIAKIRFLCPIYRSNQAQITIIQSSCLIYLHTLNQFM